jgi:hypothetical protein
VKASARAKLVERVFLRYLDARREFSRVLDLCAMKGWPDRSATVRIANRVEELFFLQLSVRLTQLVSQSGSNHGEWKEYTSTAKVLTGPGKTGPAGW